MKNPEATKDQEMLEKLIRGGQTNLSEWFEKITYEFCEEKAIEERTLVETIQKNSIQTLPSSSCAPYRLY